MSTINFNVAGAYPYDCLYYDDDYGYRACVNGQRMNITDIVTVQSLKDIMGLPDYHIPGRDVEAFEACLYGGTK